MPIEDKIKLWQSARNSRMQQHFFLPEIPPSVRLSFEPLSYTNGIVLFDLFKNDNNPYVDERFKSLEDLEDYVACMLEYARYSGKRAAFDWLLKSKVTGEYIGVIHLHDLSKEVFGNANQKATLGYAIGERYRGEGYAREAVAYFSQFLFLHTQLHRLLVYTDKGNENSIRLMKSLNWIQCDDKYVYSEQYSYFEHWK